MARCGCNPICSCLINALDTTCIDMSITGLGTPTNPYIISAVPIIDPNAANDLTCGPGGLLVLSDICTVDTPSINLTGNGSEPTCLQADVILTPDNTGPLAGTPGGGDNLLKLDPATGLYVSCEDIQDCIGASIGPSIAGNCLEYNDAANRVDVQIDADPSNQLGCGTGPTGEGLYVAPSGAVAPGDCITVTGTGEAGNPFVVNVEIDPACPQITCGPAGLCVDIDIIPMDTPTVDMVVTGTGTAGDPFIISANQICQPVTTSVATNAPCLSVTGNGCDTPLNIQLGISPDTCGPIPTPNALECRGNGLFVRGQDFDVFTNQQGSCNGTGPLVNFTGTIQIGPTICQGLLVNNTCTNMAYFLFMEARDIILAGHTQGGWRIDAEASFDGGATFQRWGFTGAANPLGNPPEYDMSISTFARTIGTSGPGGSTNVCIRMQAVLNNFTGDIGMCYVISQHGVPLGP